MSVMSGSMISSNNPPFIIKDANGSKFHFATLTLGFLQQKAQTLLNAVLMSG